MAAVGNGYAPLADPEAGLPDGSEPKSASLISVADAQVRAGFVRKVYGILGAQLALTAAIAAPIAVGGPDYIKTHSGLMWSAFIGTWVFMFAIICCRQAMREYPKNYIMLFGFTACTGILVGFASAVSSWQAVLLAVVTTALVFCGLSVYAWTTNADFTGYGGYLCAAAMSLCFFSLIIGMCQLFGFPVRGMMVVYDFIGILLFSCFIVYDTQVIMGGTHKVQFDIDEYIFAALQLYLDIVDMFLFLLDLLNSRD